jgi:hypothetical protein
MVKQKKKLYLAVPSLRAYKPATAIVYYIKLRFAEGLTLYKIGYTSMTIVKRVEGYYDYKTRRRTVGMGLPCGCTYRIIAVVYKGSKAMAYRKEQDLHNLHQMYRWNGPNRLRNGNTELYLTDVLGLDKSI